MIYDILLIESSLWNTPLLICLICLAILYLIVMHYLLCFPIFHRKTFMFLLGLILLYMTIGSPLTIISQLSFSLHMIQMSVLYFIIPPMLLANIPIALINHINRAPFSKRLTLYLLTPKMALILFASLFFVYHLPFNLFFISQYSFFKQSYSVMLFILSCRMWWPLVSPAPHKNLKRDLKKYTVLSGILIMPACLIFIAGALVSQADNPALAQMTAYLCLPADADLVHLLPYPFQTNVDQMMASLFMLGIHKISLVVTANRATK